MSMIPLEDTIHPNLSLRSALPADDEFLASVFAGTRRQELSLLNWSAKQENDFLAFQFRARNQSYRSQFPNAEYNVVEWKSSGIGSLAVERGAEIRLIDIAFLPEFRGCGFGGVLLKQLQDEAAAGSMLLILQVLKSNNQAIALYQRSGFEITGGDEVYLAMQWCKS